MSAKLPAAMAACFAATNQHDVQGMIGVFAPGAVVKDEGQEHRGSVAIGQWMRETIRKYDFKVEPTAVAEQDGTVVVTGLVSGNFPGSPLSLRHVFTLHDDEISRLEIG